MNSSTRFFIISTLLMVLIGFYPSLISIINIFYIIIIHWANNFFFYLLVRESPFIRWLWYEIYLNIKMCRSSKIQYALNIMVLNMILLKYHVYQLWIMMFLNYVILSKKKLILYCFSICLYLLCYVYSSTVVIWYNI